MTNTNKISFLILIIIMNLKFFKRSASLLQTDAASGMRHYCGVKIELLEMGDEDTWECEIVHEDGNTIKLEATMEFRPKSGNIPAVGPGTSPRSSTTFASPWDTTTPSTTNTGTNETHVFRSNRISSVYIASKCVCT